MEHFYTSFIEHSISEMNKNISKIQKDIKRIYGDDVEVFVEIQQYVKRETKNVFAEPNRTIITTYEYEYLVCIYYEEHIEEL